MADFAAPDSVEWLTSKQRDGRLLEFWRGEDLLSEIDLNSPVFDLPLLLGVFFVDDTETLRTLKQKWEAALPLTGVVFRQVPAWSNEALSAAAIELLANQVAVYQRHAGRASLDLAVYRREFDRLQRSFSRLEEYVGRYAFQRPIEIFEYSPNLAPARGSRGAESVSGTAGRVLAQTLPVDSLGVSNLWLYAIAKPDAQGDVLRVRLKAMETGRLHEEWSLSGDEVQTGWVELALTSAIDEAALSLTVEVEWPSRESKWVLALGPPHPYKEFCAEMDHERALGAPLSFRLFGGLPGVRVTATNGAIRPMGAPLVKATFVPPEVGETVEQIVPPALGGKVNLVSYDRELGCITVHPRIGGISAGRIRIVPPANAWRISATVYLAHERASSTDFGLMVGLTREEKTDNARLESLDRSATCFSGWITVAPLEEKSISAVFSTPSKGSLSVYLLTRQGPEVSPDFGWARFSKFQFNILNTATAEDGPEAAVQRLLGATGAVAPAEDEIDVPVTT